MRQKDFPIRTRSNGLYLLSAIAFVGFLIPAAGAHAAGSVVQPTVLNQPPVADWQKFATPKADKIVVFKAQRRLELRRGDEVIRSYHIALGPHPVGPKLERGDGKTPEGTYFIDRRNMASEYHLSLHISYPETADIKRAAKLNIDPGANILIHGEPNILNHEGKANLLKDWTAGCIALHNTDMDEVWRLTDDGVTVEIHP
jgi:murein L,D-transpeptidase YafK